MNFPVRNYKGGKVSKKIVEWLDSVFKSSADSGKLFKLEHSSCLADGEVFTHIAIRHGMLTGYDEVGLVRGITIYFCNGERGEHICGLQIVMYFVGHHSLAVIEGIGGTGEKGRNINFVHYWRGCAEVWKFESAIQRALGHLEPIVGCRGVPLPKGHYLSRTEPIEADVISR